MKLNISPGTIQHIHLPKLHENGDSENRTLPSPAVEIQHRRLVRIVKPGNPGFGLQPFGQKRSVRGKAWQTLHAAWCLAQLFTLLVKIQDLLNRSDTTDWWVSACSKAVEFWWTSTQDEGHLWGWDATRDFPTKLDPVKYGYPWRVSIKQDFKKTILKNCHVCLLKVIQLSPLFVVKYPFLSTLRIPHSCFNYFSGLDAEPVACQCWAVDFFFGQGAPDTGVFAHGGRCSAATCEFKKNSWK